MGYIADCKPLGGTRHATHYVTKYLTKDAQAIDIRGLRHIQTTRKIGSPKPQRTKALYVGYRLNKRDTWGAESVFDADKRMMVDAEYWQEGDVYPPLNEHID